MSKPSDFELDLDLQLLPEWARQSSTDNRYSKYEGEAERGRPGRRSGPRDGPRRPGPRQRSEGRPPARRDGARGDDQRRGGEGRQGRPSRPFRREPEIPLPELDTRFIPEPRGVESLAHQIKLTGRAYPLFEIAWLVLRKAGRYSVEFKVKRNDEGKPVQPLYACSLDHSIWLKEEDLAVHALRAHFDTFYQSEKTPTDPPKGTYTFVAKCGMSGVILGPPNYHDYQTKLRRLHSERFERMPFEAFKSRVEIVKDEEVVKKWIEDQSYTTSYVCLNVPGQLTLESHEEVEKHFRETHLPNLSKRVDTAVLPPTGERVVIARELSLLLRETTEQQRRFPLNLATALSQQFASHGLQFFKVNKTVTHVCVARPHYLDLENVTVSDGVHRIVEFINTHARCSRRTLLETLAPGIPPTPAPPAEPAPLPAENEVQDAPPTPSASAGAEKEPTSVSSSPTPEQTAVITDLHWLIHQGHVIEFSDGHMETAKQPRERPPQPKAKPAPAKAEKEKREPESPTEPSSATPADPGGVDPRTPANEPSPPAPSPVPERPAEHPEEKRADRSGTPAAQPEAPSVSEAETRIHPEPESAGEATAPESAPKPPEPPVTKATPAAPPPVSETPVEQIETSATEQPVSTEPQPGKTAASEVEPRVHPVPEPAEAGTAPDSEPKPTKPAASIPEPEAQTPPPPAPIEADDKPKPASESESPEKKPDVGQ